MKYIGIGVLVAVILIGLFFHPGFINEFLDEDLEDVEVQGDELVIVLDEDHGADFIGVQHEYDEDEFAIIREAPRFGGEMRYDLIDYFACDGTDYPTNEFNILLYKESDEYIDFDPNDEYESVTVELVIESGEDEEEIGITDISCV